MKTKKQKKNKFDGVTLADIFSKSKYGTYGNAKAIIITGQPIPKSALSEIKSS